MLKDENYIYTENELIDLCIKKQVHAQKSLYKIFSPKLFALACRYMSNKEDAKDVLQESFIKIFEKLSSFKKNGSFEGWLKRIVVNTALSKYKQNQKNIINYSADVNEWDDAEENEIPEETNSFMQLDEQTILMHIQQLPEEYRIVFNLAGIEGLSHKEISGLLGIKEETSRIRLLRARKKLMNTLSLIHIVK
ncbi:MAG: RNA polymerase sigma factor [Cytophaga sp.]|uniref:RNA polymerase sigma factor n=1 Tax=Cytophaga sp. TaxID=29535 RepID=UPI003F7D8B7C